MRWRDGLAAGACLFGMAAYASGGVTGLGLVGFLSPGLKSDNGLIATLSLSECGHDVYPWGVIGMGRSEPELGVMHAARFVAIGDTPNHPNARNLIHCVRLHRGSKCRFKTLYKALPRKDYVSAAKKHSRCLGINTGARRREIRPGYRILSRERNRKRYIRLYIECRGYPKILDQHRQCNIQADRVLNNLLRRSREPTQ